MAWGPPMAWETSDRKSRLPREWPKLVQEVKTRDGGRCTWILPSGARCPRPGTDVDHIRPGDDHRLRNLRLLCHHHHECKTVKEAWAGRARKKPKGRPEERHPGMR